MQETEMRKKLSMECAILTGLMLGAVVHTPMAIAQSGTPDAIEDQPAEKVFHNIQVLKGMRAGDLQGAMSFIASSLGVDCDYCHRGEDFGKDVRKEKSRAREMIEMVRQINQSTFHGENKVNCFTCHEGHKDPISLAPISPCHPPPPPPPPPPRAPPHNPDHPPAPPPPPPAARDSVFVLFFLFFFI